MRVDDEISLIPFYPNQNVALNWYQDLNLCKQVDNIDHVYTPEMLDNMYSYLDSHGLLYYIDFLNVLVGDMALKFDGEICIVICKEYQNMHIGSRVVKEIIRIAKEKNFSEVKAHIFSFNAQSRSMFQKCGFEQISDEWYYYAL